jgi:hypothetical protein
VSAPRVALVALMPLACPVERACCVYVAAVVIDVLSIAATDEIERGSRCWEAGAQIGW